MAIKHERTCNFCGTKMDAQYMDSYSVPQNIQTISGEGLRDASNFIRSHITIEVRCRERDDVCEKCALEAAMKFIKLKLGI